MMQRMGSGALSPKGIIQSISAKGGELMQGRRGQGFLSNDVKPLLRLCAFRCSEAKHCRVPKLV